MPDDNPYPDGNMRIWYVDQRSIARESSCQGSAFSRQSQFIPPLPFPNTQSLLAQTQAPLHFHDSESHGVSLPHPDGWNSTSDPSSFYHNHRLSDNTTSDPQHPHIPPCKLPSPHDDQSLCSGPTTGSISDGNKEEGGPNHWRNFVTSPLSLKDAAQYTAVTEHAPSESIFNHLPTPPYPADPVHSAPTSYSRQLESLPNYTWEQLCQGRRNRQSPTLDQLSTAIRDDQTDISKFGPMDKAFIDYGRSHLASFNDDVLTAAIVQHTERRSRLVSALDQSVRDGRPLQKFEGKGVPFGLDEFSYVAGCAHFGERVLVTALIDNDPQVGDEDAESCRKKLEEERREMCMRAV